MALSTTPPSIRDQYHHAIPRFILLRFQLSPSSPLLTSRQRKTLEWKASKKHNDIDTIFYYDLATGALGTPPLSRSYGKINLYRDGKNADNVDYLEYKLAMLEKDAAVVINSIHSGLEHGNFTISRLDLATLRKFLFLIYYRNDALSSTYYQENNPKNAPLANWIRKFKKTRPFSTEADIWRDGLKYYLETPHQDIVVAAEQIRERYGKPKFQEMMKRGIDPDLGEKWYAIDYESQANYFFLGVWEAANDAEFVLARNGFGLWEGLVYRSPEAHRLFAVSPRIAIVLRRTWLHTLDPDDPSALESSLADIDIREPKVVCADKSICLDATDEAWDIEKATAYRSSPQAQNDLFTFPITKLDSAETYAVNEVVLMNADAHSTGSLTFASPTAMLDTLKRYTKSHNTFLARKHSLFQPLLTEILKTSTNDAATVGPSCDESLTLAGDFNTDADYQLNMLLRFTFLNGIKFPSLYNRAYLVYHMATDAMSLSNSISSKIREITEDGILKFQLALYGPRQSSTPGPESTTTATLVETLSKEESDIFFARFGSYIDELGIGRHSNDPLANIIYEAAMIGISH